MPNPLRGHRIAVAAGMLSLLALVVSALALTDIAHGEPDLSLEWTVLRVCAVVVLGFHVMAIAVLARGLRGGTD